MPDGRKIAESIQGDLAEIGIKIDIVSYEWGTYLKKLQNGEHDMCLIGWTGDMGDPDNFLYILLDKDSTKIPAQNYSFYRSEPLHKLLMAAKKESNIDIRTKLYKEAQEIIHKDIPVVPLVHSIELLPYVIEGSKLTLRPNWAAGSIGFGLLSNRPVLRK